MSRPLRILYPGAWYHVMNRGGEHRIIFRDERDYRSFLALLDEAAQMWKIEVHAYCLLPNHYHLLIRTAQANLPRAIRHINGVYTQRHNRRWGRDSQLFRGRYKAILVDDDAYLIELARYIHLNPVKAKLAKNAENYPWSSYPYYLGRKKSPECLVTSAILGHFGKKQNKARKGLALFTQDRIPEKLEKMLNGKRWPSALGNEGFEDWVGYNFVSQPKEREVTYESRPKDLSLKQVVDSVCRAGDLSWREIQDNKDHTLWRKLAILALRQKLGFSYDKIAKAVGNIHPSQISRLIHKERNRLEATPEWNYVTASLKNTKWAQNAKVKT